MAEAFQIFDKSLQWSNNIEVGYARLAYMLEGFPDCYPVKTGSALKRISKFAAKGLSMSPLTDLDLLIPLLLNPSITVLIFPRDRNIRVFYQAMKRIGLSLGNDISVISFDNELEFLFYQINSVDLGISNFGYRIFHTLMGDIGFKRDTSIGDLIAKPVVAERGSVKNIR